MFFCNGRFVANSLILSVSMQLKALFQFFVDEKKVEALLRVKCKERIKNSLIFKTLS